MLVVISYLNVKIGHKILVRRGLGSRNEHGDMWVDLCVTHVQVITNTWFQLQNKHLYTWENNHCSTRYEQGFRHNKHTHTYQLLQIKLPGTIIKCIANYIKGRLHNIYKSHILTTSILPRKWLTSGRASGRKNKLDESPKAFFKATLEVGDQI